MTALAQYQRLESTALWRDSKETQRREVLVALGDATLVITALPDTPLSHWSLPAIERLNPGQNPALYAPGSGSPETLEIAEPQMIAAIETVRGAIEHARPHPGRLRFGLVAIAIAGVLALAVFWLPGALMRQTASLLPEAKRIELGQELLTQMTALTGRACVEENGAQALGRLSARLFGTQPPRIVVLPRVIAGTLHVPGDTLVIDRGLVEDYEAPEVVAGFLMAENLHRQAQDPVIRMLEQGGLVATIRLLTTGDLPQTVLHDHAMQLLTNRATMAETTALLASFDAAQISSEPYAYALDISGETTLPLIEADPMRGAEPVTALSDQSWIALQGICGA
ncbi:MAG: hypothetical protein AAF689_17035 [Pseudomonadota bacterium]